MPARKPKIDSAVWTGPKEIRLRWSPEVAEQPNTPPYVEITSPLTGASVTDVSLVSFACTATDAEDGDLSGGSVVWTSSLDGQIGTGTAFSNTLSVGSHTITCTVTDSGGLTDTDTVNVTVSAYVPDPSGDPQPGQGPGIFDGPAELPRSVPSYTRSFDFTGNEHIITNTSDLTTLLDGGSVAGQTLQEGDCITLTAGTTYTFWNKDITVSNILIRTSAWASLPPSGTRVNDSHLPLMPVLNYGSLQTGNFYLLKVKAKTDNVRFVGISFNYPRTNISITLSALVYANEQWNIPEPGDECHGIHFDACHFFAGFKSGVIRLLSMNAMDSVIVDCHFWNDLWLGNDTQAIWCERYAERILVQNCLLVAAGENFMSGGAGNPIPTGTDSKDLTFRRCYFHKPLEWKGQNLTSKNNFELKHGIRVLLEDCVLDNWFKDDQEHMINLKDSQANASTTDVTVRWCDFPNCDGFFALNKQIGNGFGRIQVRQVRSWHPTKLTIRGNIVSGNDINFEHVTLLSPGQGIQAFFQLGTSQYANFNLRNSIVGDRGPYGYFQSGPREAAALENTYPGTWTVEGNVMAGRVWYPNNSAAIPGNLRIEQADCGFVDVTGRLEPDSPIIGAGIGGVTPGVDHDELDYRTRHTRSGNWNQ